MIAALSTVIFLAGQGYNPLATTEPEPRPVDLSLTDVARERQIPIRVYLPSATKAEPVVLFSHGLGGNREGSAFLGLHWAKRGYVAVFLQHPGSDDSVWKDVPVAQRLAAMRRAAGAENFLLRAQDVGAALDQLAELNLRRGSPLFGRLDLEHIGMSGHSFGAVTTQAVSGQSFGRMGQQFTDSRIDAAIAFGPNNPNPGRGAEAFGSVRIPWLLMTGTKDTSPIGNATVESRMDVFPNLPETIDRYQIVLFDAEHSAFTDRALPGDRERRNPNHHRVILGLSTAFWDAYLKGNVRAKEWLAGVGARSLFEEGDRWLRRMAQAK